MLFGGLGQDTDEDSDAGDVAPLNDLWVWSSSFASGGSASHLYQADACTTPMKYCSRIKHRSRGLWGGLRVVPGFLVGHILISALNCTLYFLTLTSSLTPPLHM